MPSVLSKLESVKAGIFGQAIEIEKLAGQFYKIISQNWPVFKFIDSWQNKGKYHVKYIYYT